MTLRLEILDPAPPAVRHEVLRPTGDLDHALFRDPGDDHSVFDLSLAEQRRQAHAYVRDAFALHVERCPAYAAFVRSSGGELRLPADYPFEAIPVIPATVFKRRPVLSVPEHEIERWTLSSGTLGTQSRVPRDRLTLERLLGSVRTGLALIEEWYEDEVELVNLGPERAQAGLIWFPYVMSLVELLYPTWHAVHDGRFDPAATVAHIAQALDRTPQVGIVGPPPLLLDMIESGVRLPGGDRITIVTAGGWKRASGRALPRAELEARACEAFGLTSNRQIRDAFNQAELNTVIMECTAHRKHVPCWVHATARDPRTLEILPRGQRGLLSYLDGSAQSYPAFIVSDDVGVVDEGLCECGREGVFLTLERRVEGRAQRGCALSIDKAYGNHRNQETNIQ